MIEHRRLEHSAIPASVEQVFGLQPMTVRDSAIVGLQNQVQGLRTIGDLTQYLDEAIPSSRQQARPDIRNSRT
jgi:hypothetical protein